MDDLGYEPKYPNVQLHEELIERSWGVLEGQPGSEHAIERLRCMDDPHAKPKDGESMGMVISRQRRYWSKHALPLLRDGQNLIVSAHSGSLAALQCVIEHKQVGAWKNYLLPTAGIRIYRFDKYMKLEIVQ